MAVVKNVLGESVTVTTPWMPPVPWPAFTNPNWQCGTCTVTGPQVLDVAPTVVGQHWTHQYTWTVTYPTPQPDPGPPFELYNTPATDADPRRSDSARAADRLTWPNVYTDAGDLLGSGAVVQPPLDVVGTNTKLVNWGLLVFSTARGLRPRHAGGRLLPSATTSCAMIDTSDKGDVTDDRDGAAALRQRRHQRVRQHAHQRRARLRQDDPAGASRRAPAEDAPIEDDLGNSFSARRPTPSSSAAASTPRSWSPTVSPTSGTRAVARPSAPTNWGNWREPCLACDCAQRDAAQAVQRRPRVPGRRRLRGHVPRPVHGVRGRQGRGRLARGRARPGDRPAQPAQGPHLGDRHQPGGRAVRAELHRLPRPHRRLRPLRPGRDRLRRPAPTRTSPRGPRARTTARPRPTCARHLAQPGARQLRVLRPVGGDSSTTRSGSCSAPTASATTRPRGPRFPTPPATPLRRQHRLHHHRRVPGVARPRVRLRPECPDRLPQRRRLPDGRQRRRPLQRRHRRLQGAGHVPAALGRGPGAERRTTIPQPRRIYTWNPGASGNKLIPVETASIADLNAVCGNCGFDGHVVDFVRGNDGNGTPRPWQLGAIVNSTAAIIGKPEQWKQFTGHSSFETTYATRNTVAWMGASDGMLHAFDVKDGAELVALIPPDRLADQVKLYDNYKANPTDDTMGQQILPSEHLYGVASSPRFADVWDGSELPHRDVHHRGPRLAPGCTRSTSRTRPRRGRTPTARRTPAIPTTGTARRTWPAPPSWRRRCSRCGA